MFKVNLKFHHFVLAVILGSFIGFVVTLSQAQELPSEFDIPVNGAWGECMPLSQVLTVFGGLAGYESVVDSATNFEQCVVVPENVHSMSGLINIWSGLYSFCPSISSGFFLVTDGECIPGESFESDSSQGSELLTSSVSLDEVAQQNAPISASASPSRYRLTISLLQISKNYNESLGIDLSEGAFLTAAQLVFGADYIFSGYFPQPDFDKIFDFLTASGVSLRRDDYSLGVVSGQDFSFNRGGNINVQIAGDGQENIEKSFAYGLSVSGQIVPIDDGLDLTYSWSDVSPSSVSNVSLIDLSSTSSEGREIIPCDSVVVLNDSYSERRSQSGEGLPAASEIPVLGYLAGKGESLRSVSSYVVTLGVTCLS